MLTFDTPQQTAVDADHTITWLFEVTPVGQPTLYWSTDEITVDAQPYAYRIIPERFAGINGPRIRKEAGLRVPTTCSFSMVNVEEYDRGYFAGASVMVRLLLNEVEEIAWKMAVYTCDPGQGVLDFVCHDFLQPYLDGDWPLTALLTDADKKANKDTCLPVLIGEAFLPIELIVAASTPYFVLGPAGTYTVIEVRSPKAWDDSAASWLASGYTMSQATVTANGVACRTLRPIINDSDNNGVADACGFWIKGDRLPMPTRYTCAATASLTNFADAIDWVLQELGVAAGDIDAASFAAAGSVFTSQGLTCNGGWTKRQSRAAMLASLLNQCHATLDVRDKIYLRPLSKTPVATISDCLCDNERRTSFRYTPVPPSGQAADSGHIIFSPPDTPADTTITAVVSITTTKDNQANQSLVLNMVHDSVVCQKLGRLCHQRSMPGIANPAWRLDFSWLALQPDDVVTINNALYGGTYPVLIDEIMIERTGALSINAIRFGHTLDDFEDITGLSAITLPADDLSAGWQADPKATWGAPVGTLVGDTDAQTVADASAFASATVGDMEDDGVLSTPEKATWRLHWPAMVAHYEQVIAQATSWGIEAETVFVNLYNTGLAMGLYLVNTLHVWDQPDANATISPANTLSNYVEAYFDQLQLAVNRLVAITNEFAVAAQATADEKRRVFVAQPTTPYELGDLWDAGGTPRIVKRCTTARASGAYVAGDWTDISNLVTNTNQVTDGANLGGTSTWAGVSGTGKPEDGADVTATATMFTGSLSSNGYVSATGTGGLSGIEYKTGKYAFGCVHGHNTAYSSTSANNRAGVVGYANDGTNQCAGVVGKGAGNNSAVGGTFLGVQYGAEGDTSDRTTSAYGIFSSHQTYSTDNIVIGGGNILPSSNNARQVGAATQYFNKSYTDTVYYKTATTFDSLDDLEVISAMAPVIGADGKPKMAKNGGYQMDRRTIHDALTNRAEIVQELRLARRTELLRAWDAHEQTEGVNMTPRTLSDIEIMELDEELEELEAMPPAGIDDFYRAISNDAMFRVSSRHDVDADLIRGMEFDSLESMISISIGGVRQLNKETTLLIENLNAMFEYLVDRVSKLERSKAA